MNLEKLFNTPEWKIYFTLGEKLLNQSNTSAQANYIEQMVGSTLGAEVQVWFVKPAYPLPGEPEIRLLPNDDAPDSVQSMYCEYQGICGSDEIVRKVNLSDPDSKQITATVPLITQDYLLGILHLERPGGPHFRKEEVNFLEGLVAHAALTLQTFRQVQIKNWRFEQLALVRSVNDQIAHIKDVHLLCERVTQLIEETFHYYNITLFTLNEQQGTLEFQAIAGHSKNILDQQPPEPFLVGEGMVGTVAQTGKEIIAPDVRQEPHYQSVPSLPETRSEVALPLRVGDRILGVLDLQSDHPDAFHEYDLMVLYALADTIALAIEGARLFSNLRWQADQITAVLDVSYAITSILELDQLLDEVVELIHERFGYSYVHLYLAHWGRRVITYAAGRGGRRDDIIREGLSYPIDNPYGMIPHVARTGETLLANDIHKEPMFRPYEHSNDDTQSELTIPLKFASEVLGVLDIQSIEINGFDKNNIQIFESLASSVALAIRNATLYRTEQWRRQVADSFREVAHLLSSGARLDTLLQKILSELQRNLPTDAAAIWLMETKENEDVEHSNLKPLAVQGIDPSKFDTLDDPGDMLDWIETIMAAEAPVVRIPEDPYCPLGKALGFPQDYSSIAVRLMSGNKAMGVLALAHSSSGRYGNEARAMTSTFSGYASVAIQNARLFASSQEQAWLATVLLQVSEACQSITDMDELLETMVRLTPLLAGVNQCAFFIWDENSQAFILHSHYGMSFPDLGTLLFDPSVPAFSNLINNHAPIIINNPAVELHIPLPNLSDQENLLLFMPMQSHGQLLGAFLVGHQSTDKNDPEFGFDQNTSSILQGIAHQTSVAIENIKLLETRQQEAYVTAVLLQVAQAIVSQDNLHDTLDAILNLLPIFAGIDTCVIYMWDPVEEQYTPHNVYTGSKQLDETILGVSYKKGSYPILDTVIENMAMVVAPQIESTMLPHDWHLLTCMSPGLIPTIDEVTRNSWVLGMPISVKGELFGVVLVKQNGTPQAFQERRLELMNGIAQQTALAIQNDRLKQEMVGRERLEREIQVARQIQQTFLPDHLPVVKGWEIDTRWQTARQVGGDFYDIIRLPKGRLGLVIADVSDKGLPAALYMTVARTLIRAMLHVESPAKVLEKVNKLLLVDSPNGLFVTAIYSILNIEKKELVYTNAGHNRPLLFRSSSGKVEQLPLGGMALGVMERNKYQEHVIQLDSNDMLLLYTDGLPDTLSPDMESFGEDRIIQTIISARGRTTSEILQSFDEELANFRLGTPLNDDLTMVALRCLP